MLPKNMKDVYFEVNRKHDPTFGLLDEKGQPTETVMTNKSDYGTKKCIDYIYAFMPRSSRKSLDNNILQYCSVF